MRSASRNWVERLCLGAVLLLYSGPYCGNLATCAHDRPAWLKGRTVLGVVRASAGTGRSRVCYLSFLALSISNYP